MSHPPSVAGIKDASRLSSPTSEEMAAASSRSLLSPEDLRLIETRQFLSIDEVRSLIQENSIHRDFTSIGLNFIDPDLVIQIDIQTNYSIFILDGAAYSREEILRMMPFEELQTQPEYVFSRQEIGVFALEGNTDEYEFIARDLGDPEPFAAVLSNDEDPIHTVITKVFFSKSRLDEFKTLASVYQSAKQFVPQSFLDYSRTESIGDHSLSHTHSVADADSSNGMCISHEDPRANKKLASSKETLRSEVFMQPTIAAQIISLRAQLRLAEKEFHARIAEISETLLEIECSSQRVD